MVWNVDKSAAEQEASDSGHVTVYAKEMMDHSIVWLLGGCAVASARKGCLDT